MAPDGPRVVAAAVVRGTAAGHRVVMERAAVSVAVMAQWAWTMVAECQVAVAATIIIVVVVVVAAAAAGTHRAGRAWAAVQRAAVPRVAGDSGRQRLFSTTIP